MFVSINPDKFGERIGLGGKSFWDSVLEASGNNLHDYIRKKELKLKTSGFKSRPILLSTSFRISGIHELVDGYLGLKPFYVSRMTCIETRYDIPLTKFKDESGTLTISPSKLCDVEVEINNLGLTLKTKIVGELIVPVAPLPSEHYKCLINCKFFRLDITTKNLAFNVLSEVFGLKAASVDEWIDVCTAFAVLNNGEFDFSFKSEMTRKVSYSYKGLRNEDAYTYWMETRKIFLSLRQLLDLGGLFSPQIKLDELENLESEIFFVTNIFNRSSEPDDRFEFTTSTRLPVPEGDIDLLCIGHVKLGALHFGYYFRSKMEFVCEDHGSTLTASTFEPGEIAALNNFPEEYERFAEIVRTRLNSEKVILNQLVFMKPPELTCQPFIL